MALAEKLKAYLLFNVEPQLDCSNPAQAMSAMQQAECVCVFTPYVNSTMLDYADIILPIAAFGETSGTFVNVEGRWQSFSGCVKPVGETRPAWKVLRVLGNLFGLSGFDYTRSDEIRDEIKAHVDATTFVEPALYCPSNLGESDAQLKRITEWPLYAG